MGVALGAAAITSWPQPSHTLVPSFLSTAQSQPGVSPDPQVFVKPPHPTFTLPASPSGHTLCLVLWLQPTHALTFLYTHLTPPSLPGTAPGLPS